MSETTTEELKSVQQRTAILAQAIPGVLSGFKKLSDEATKPGSLSPGLKELIAATLGVTRLCEDCILFHLSAAKRHGASRQELVELLGIAVEMGGGPAIVYAGKALKIFDSLS
ncbi:MAG: carboxymuconolactone decarboxylase family protein [Acetobacteraceae bacterium]|nr:carboxymuconolactone decarboxylase family protein [Acetobacteraceae bacterium]MBV8589279.1 carboxymuconolactone decarboxylase family protein [Acetobacteraceae bacterium]